jgi:hypothetical protein
VAVAAPAADLWNRSIFAGSAWVLTLLGTVITMFTLYQVRSKNSAFRRALVITSRRRSNQELRDIFRRLRQISGKISSAEPVALARLAGDWMETAAKALAVFEASSARDPLDLSSRGVGRWTTEDGRRFSRALTQRRPGEDVAGDDPPPVRLYKRLPQSCDAARTYLMAPSDDSRRDLQQHAAWVVQDMAYVCARLGFAETGDFHDDR